MDPISSVAFTCWPPLLSVSWKDRDNFNISLRPHRPKIQRHRMPLQPSFTHWLLFPKPLLSEWNLGGTVDFRRNWHQYLPSMQSRNLSWSNSHFLWKQSMKQNTWTSYVKIKSTILPFRQLIRNYFCFFVAFSTNFFFTNENIEIITCIGPDTMSNITIHCTLHLTLYNDWLHPLSPPLLSQQSSS